MKLRLSFLPCITAALHVPHGGLILRRCHLALILCCTLLRTSSDLIAQTEPTAASDPSWYFNTLPPTTSGYETSPLAPPSYSPPAASPTVAYAASAPASGATPSSPSTASAASSGTTILSLDPMTDEVSSLIEEKAKNLEDDPLKIYLFVKNKIDYEPYWGAKKGAALTLLENSGSDADQCALLAALLKSAKTRNPAIGAIEYKLGYQTIPKGTNPAGGGIPTDQGIYNWLGLHHGEMGLVRERVERHGFILMNWSYTPIRQPGTPLPDNTSLPPQVTDATPACIFRYTL
jgi:hypothetical protein